MAIEAGALISTTDGGRTWRDRVTGSPWDTHELAVHPDAPDTLRVAAGDGYFESRDGGSTWKAPAEGLDIGYFRSVAIDPGRMDVVLLSGATGPRTTYVAGRSDGRLYRRTDGEEWQRVVDGWPDPPSTLAPLLLAGDVEGELWAADERGLHRTEDSGRRWQQVASFPATPNYVRGIASLG
ncbi:MAG: hypothetical protein GEU90_21835 [Gemmatimonas sp.]|nr:hypothetical protein [Gemmatimonas sp.]